MPKTPAKASDEHEFYSLEQKPFEHFAAALHGAQLGILYAKTYAPDGQKQFGIDHVAFARDATGRSVLEVGQSKAYRRFGPSDLIKAADKFLENWESRWRGMKVRKLIIFVGCVVKSGKTDDELIKQTDRFAALDTELELWDAWQIYNHLPDAPQVVSTHLGRDYHVKLFGDASAPFADLQRELLRGDMGGQRAISLIVRLNQAETAELDQLKRRVHQGEADAVYRHLEGTLHQPGVSDAIAPEVRAGMERLLAGLAIARADHSYAKLLLDRADGRDGKSSARLRAILVLEADSADALLRFTDGDTDEGVREVRAVAHLRNGAPDRALAELAPALQEPDPSVESLRLAALTHLVLGDREEAVTFARRAVAREPEMRAALQALGVALYNATLSATVKPELGDWPQPVDLAFVQSGDVAQTRLAEAAAIFSKLARIPGLADHETCAAWHIAATTLKRGGREAAVAAVAAMEAGAGLTPAVVAWAMSHALDFDPQLAASSLDKCIADNDRDLQAILVRVALANFMADRSAARSLLAQHRNAFEDAGHREVYNYWQAVTDLEDHRPPDTEVIREHAWLDLRAAFSVQAKKPRLKAISRVVERQSGPDGDPRVLLTGLQMLLEAGWYKVPAKYASRLIEEIGTAEAIIVAAQALHRAGEQEKALAALDRTEAFSGGMLPESLERLRVACLAASGKLPAAAQASALLAMQSQSPQDLWSSINFHISMGAVPDALALWTANKDTLKEPSPGHLMLARAAIHVDPEAARRVTAQIAQRVPDEMVGAAFDLSTRLGMRERSQLMRRIVGLGSNNGAGVLRIDSVDQALALIEERQQALNDAQAKYNQGHAPIHFLPGWRPGAVAAAYLGSVEMAAARRSSGEILSARYGRRFDPAIWPSDRKDVRLVADVTALLTAHQLGLLDPVERAFKPIRIGSDALNAIATMRVDLDEMQPDRIEAMRAVQVYRGQGLLEVENDEMQLDPFTVRWSCEGSEPSSTLNFSRFFEALRPDLDSDNERAARRELGTTISEPAHGVLPPVEAVINLEAGMAVLLEQAGVLPAAMRTFRIRVPADQLSILDAQIAGAEERRMLLAALGRLYDRLAAGVADGTYAFVAPVKERFDQPLAASLMQALAASGDGVAIFWADDRFVSSIDNPQLRVVTSVEVLDAVHRFGRLSSDQLAASRQRLRAIDWMFLPITGEEIEAAARRAIQNQDFAETDEIVALRRGIASVLRHRRLIQWPDPAALDRGLRGEVPFLLDLGHAVTAAVTGLWSTQDVAIDAAAHASSWLIDHMDIDQYPMQVLAPDDPRSDQLQGVRLGYLILNALQIVPVGPKRERQERYLAWVWHAIVKPRLEDRPEMTEPTLAMIEQHVTGIDDPLDDRKEQDLWRNLCGTFLNALPEPLRDQLLSRPAVRDAFGLEGHGTITIGHLRADEEAFWTAIAALAPGRSVFLAVIDADKKARFTITLALEDPGGPDHHINVDLGSGGYRIDDWCWRVGQEDPRLRRTALEDRSKLLDRSGDQLDALNDKLGMIAERDQRIRAAELASSETMAAWYDRFATAVGDRHGFALHELLPERATPVLQWLRMPAGETVAGAARTIVDERGVLAMIDRLGALPIEPNEVMIALFAQASPDERGAMARDLDNLPPWHALLVSELLRAGGHLTPTLLRKIKRVAIAAANDVDCRKEWQLFASLTRYIAAHAPELEDWASLGAEQQLAFIWAHASKIAICLIAAQVDPASVADYLDKLATFSPRELVERRAKYVADAADPALPGGANRLRTRSALPLLLALNDKRETGRLYTMIKTLLVEEGGKRGNEALLPAALVSSVFPDSFFCIDLGPSTAELFPVAQYSFGAAMMAMLEHLFAEPAESPAFRRAWTFLRQASGDAPLPMGLAELARSRVTNLIMTEYPDGLTPALHTVIAVAALAAVNDWPEVRAQIDNAVRLLLPVAAEIEGYRQFRFEIAHWSARLQPVSYERGRVIVEALRDIAADPEWTEWSISVAHRYAKALAGVDAEPFIDFVAERRS